LHDDGSLLSTVVNGICLALLDAGLAMNYLVVAISCCIYNDNILLDPVSTEELGASATSTLVFSSNENILLMSKTNGAIDQHSFFKLLTLSRSASQKIVTFLRITAEKRAEKGFIK